MEPTLVIVFWSCILLTAYTYAGYPLAIGLLSRLRPHLPGGSCPQPLSASFVIAARGEGGRIGERIRELKSQLVTANVDGEIILVLDGYANNTLSAQLDDHGPLVKVVQLRENVGKAAAISIGVENARCEIVAFADVRQRWADDALCRLLGRFQDSQVGAVSGDLVLESSGANHGVGLYWRYEKWLRRQESEFDSVVGVTGAIAAVRRSAFHSIPAGTLLDDVIWPMMVVMGGSRVVHESSAMAFDRLPDDARDEFRRKVRTLAGNYQLLVNLPVAFAPWKNRVWIQLISHKMLRLAVPWALVGAFGAPALLTGMVYALAFRLQLIVYTVLIIGALCGPAKRPRWLSAGISFAMLNVAAWIAFWVWISGQASKSWSAVRYSSDN